MRADGCDNHTGNTRVNHTGSCCQGVGSATCGRGNYDTCRKGGGGEKRKEKGQKWREREEDVGSGDGNQKHFCVYGNSIMYMCTILTHC